jgi:hypothetical protein
MGWWLTFTAGLVSGAVSIAAFIGFGVDAWSPLIRIPLAFLSAFAAVVAAVAFWRVVMGNE